MRSASARKRVPKSAATAAPAAPAPAKPTLPPRPCSPRPPKSEPSHPQADAETRPHSHPRTGTGHGTGGDAPARTRAGTGAATRPGTGRPEAGRPAPAEPRGDRRWRHEEAHEPDPPPPRSRRRNPRPGPDHPAAAAEPTPPAPVAAEATRGRGDTHTADRPPTASPPVARAAQAGPPGRASRSGPRTRPRFGPRAPSAPARRPDERADVSPARRRRRAAAPAGRSAPDRAGRVAPAAPDPATPKAPAPGPRPDRPSPTVPVRAAPVGRAPRGPARPDPRPAPPRRHDQAHARADREAPRNQPARPADRFDRAQQGHQRFDEARRTGRTGRPRPSGDDRPGTGRPGTPAGRGRPGEAEDDDKKKGIGAVTGRDARARGRATTGRDRKPSTDRNSVIIGAGGSVELIDQQAGSRRGPRAALISKMKRRQQQQVVKKEGPVEIAEPITVRSLSEAIGMKTGELGKRLLKETNQLYGNNSAVAFDVAELIAIEKGITLVLKKQATAESRLLDEYEKRARDVDPELLQPGPRSSRSWATSTTARRACSTRSARSSASSPTSSAPRPAGSRRSSAPGRSRRTRSGSPSSTRPGTRRSRRCGARGAKVTDICVIVVAATDGVMPQTEEAIAHARAADVDIIVAINKVDMPNANVDKTRRQLLLPQPPPRRHGRRNAVRGNERRHRPGRGGPARIGPPRRRTRRPQGRPEPPRLRHLPRGYQDADEGVKATLIVQQGTLRKGDVVLCGATFGRVRAMYNDLGPAHHGGRAEYARQRSPASTRLPDADDPFYAVEDIATAREIAEKRKVSLRGAGLNQFAPVSLDSLAAVKNRAKITELKVVLKAEARAPSRRSRRNSKSSSTRRSAAGSSTPASGRSPSPTSSSPSRARTTRW